MRKSEKFVFACLLASAIGLCAVLVVYSIHTAAFIASFRQRYGQEPDLDPWLIRITRDYSYSIPIAIFLAVFLGSFSCAIAMALKHPEPGNPRAIHLPYGKCLNGTFYRRVFPEFTARLLFFDL